MNRDGPSPYEPFDFVVSYKSNVLLRIGWLQKQKLQKKIVTKERERERESYKRKLQKNKS